jgi:hypothetical protein
MTGNDRPQIPNNPNNGYEEFNYDADAIDVVMKFGAPKSPRQ